MIKHLSFVTAVLMMVGLAPLQADALEGSNVMGLFFEHPDDIDWEEVDEHGRHPATNFGGPSNTSTNMYLVLINADVSHISGYECSIQRPQDLVFISLDVASQTHGWHNSASGNVLNHLVTFSSGLPVDAGNAVVLCTMVLSFFGTIDDSADILLGPAMPRGIADWDGPIIVGPDPDEQRPAFLTCGINGQGFQVVATVNGEGITEIESRTWTQVKGLFQ